MRHLLRDGVVRQDRLIRVSLLSEFHVAEEQHSGDHLPDGAQVFLRDAHDAHGLVGGLKLLHVVDAGHRDVAGRQESVVLGIFQDVLFCEKEKKESNL